MKVKQCAGQHFFLCPSPDSEVPGTFLLPERTSQNSNVEAKPCYNSNIPALPGHRTSCNPKPTNSEHDFPVSTFSCHRKPLNDWLRQHRLLKLVVLSSYLTPRRLFPTHTSERSYWFAKAAASSMILLTLAGARYPPDGKK